MYRHKLLMTQEQITVLREALDLYMRIGLGQWGECVFYAPRRKDSPDTGKVHDLLLTAKQEHTGLPGSQSYGIGAPEVSLNTKRAADMWRVLRGGILFPENGDQPLMRRVALDGAELLVENTEVDDGDRGGSGGS